MDKNAFDINQKFYDNYINFEGTTVQEQMESFIENSFLSSIEHEVHNNLVRETTEIDYYCYECRKPIKVDISHLIRFGKDIDESDFLCDLHKNDVVISKYSVAFYRYEHLFMNKVRKLLEIKLI